MRRYVIQSVITRGRPREPSMPISLARSMPKSWVLKVSYPLGRTISGSCAISPRYTAGGILIYINPTAFLRNTCVIGICSANSDKVPIYFIFLANFGLTTRPATSRIMRVQVPLCTIYNFLIPLRYFLPKEWYADNIHVTLGLFSAWPAKRTREYSFSTYKSILSRTRGRSVSYGIVFGEGREDAHMQISC